MLVSYACGCIEVSITDIISITDWQFQFAQ